MRMYPIQNGPSVPWEVLSPHESQCQKNHQQSINRIAERGGFSPAEAWAVINGLELSCSGLSNGLTWDQAEQKWHEYAERINNHYTELENIKSENKSITEKLHAYEKQWADMDTTIAHLRQENAELKTELLCKETEWAKIFESLKAKLLEIQTSAEIDPNTAIAYGLYPSSARPVNPKT